jgi:8-oxo-dGDP phosphatase
VETLSTSQVYANSWMTVREDTIRRGDGSTGIYGVVDKPTYALVIPVEGSRIHLVEQYRYPLAARSWEFPQGTAPDRLKIEPRELAARELREETGLTATQMTFLGTVAVAPGLSSQTGSAYLATALTEGSHAREHEEQDMRSAWWERTMMEKAMRDGVIVDAQSLAAYALLLLHEKNT